jgi:predicted DNA-binding transcriptional regulator YafY
VFYWGKVWTLAAWCEARCCFRNFRVDRIEALLTLPERFESEDGKTLADLLRADGVPRAALDQLIRP